MSPKAKKRARVDPDIAAKFLSADPHGDGLRRAVVATMQNTPSSKLVEMLDAAHRGAKFPAGRRKGAKNKPTTRIEAMFDKLLRDNPDCSAEEIRTLKGPKSVRAMGKSTAARHWAAAKKRVSI